MVKIVPVKTFGSHLDLKNYKLRPGSFLLLLNNEGKLALINTPKGYYLPGGGWERDENAREALNRELVEELGISFPASKIKYWGRNNSCFSDISAQRNYLMMNFYFTAQIQYLKDVGEPLEKDHKLVWKKPTEISQLKLPSAQKDMIFRFLNLR